MISRDDHSPARVSVALCTYNGEQYLGDQLNSIATQSHKPYEIVVCDDASSDQTREIVRSFASTSPIPVYLYENEYNLGVPKNFERAVSRCSGDLIALSDQDDVWMPDKLARCAAVLSERLGVGLVFSDADVVDERLNPLGYRLWESAAFSRERQRVFDEGDPLVQLILGNVVTGATMMFRSAFRGILCPAPAGGLLIHDGWIAACIAAVADLAYIDEPLMLYRQHARQVLGAECPRPPDAPKWQLESRHNVRMNAYARAVGQTEATLGGLFVLRERLTEHGHNTTRVDMAIDHISDRIRHLRARLNMPVARPYRLPMILRELVTLRYFRHSAGAYSALADLTF